MRRKRLIFIPFLALAAVTALGATAFACTIFRGTFTIDGNGSGSTPVTATGSGTRMTHKSISSGIAKAKSDGGTVTVSTGVDPLDATNKMPSGAYQIRFYNSIYPPLPAQPGFKDHQNWTNDCMAGSVAVDLGVVQVGADGKISSGTGTPQTGQPETFSLPPALTKDQAPAESAVCISTPTGSTGNQAPLTIV